MIFSPSRASSVACAAPFYLRATCIVACIVSLSRPSDAASASTPSNAAIEPVRSDVNAQPSPAVDSGAAPSPSQRATDAAAVIATSRQVAPLDANALLGASDAPPVIDYRLSGDGVYGRFDGDVDLSLAGGAVLGPDGPAAALFARLFFLQTAGFYVGYTDGLGRDSTRLPRTLSLGVAVRPLFIPRWGYDYEHGPALLDLTLDAITFDVGLLWPSNQEGALREKPGVEIALGTEVPLFGKAAGPFLGARGALRWRGSELAARPDDGKALAPALFLTLSWHALADLGIVDIADRRMR